MTDGHLFNNISLGGRVGNNPGQFRLYLGGVAWKKQGGGKTIEVDKADIVYVTWMKIPRSYQLSVGTKEGIQYVFKGFREQFCRTVIVTVETARVCCRDHSNKMHDYLHQEANRSNGMKVQLTAC
ncbi:FACT complex subunit SSRP1-B [Hordeum vulgare]|nr:FACT complex subunit SSRP1-B [Hordeum vulgare]